MFLINVNCSVLQIFTAASDASFPQPEAGVTAPPVGQSSSLQGWWLQTGVMVPPVWLQISQKWRRSEGLKQMCIIERVCVTVQNQRREASGLIKAGAAGDRWSAMIVTVCHGRRPPFISQHSRVAFLTLFQDSVIRRAWMKRNERDGARPPSITEQQRPRTVRPARRCSSAACCLLPSAMNQISLTLWFVSNMFHHVL